MEAFKISVEVNVNFSDNTMRFLSSLFGKGPTAPIMPSAPATSEAKVPTQKPTVVAKPAQIEKPAAPVKSEPVAHAQSASSIKIDQVRKALAEKVNDHRADIKAKLEEFGAPSVTKLSPDKYEEMYNFLIAL